MEHLLNNCIFTSTLWDSFATIIQQNDRDKGSIINSLNRWRRTFSGNEILSSAWAIMPSFIIWNVWKERNNRIFKNEKRSSQNLFERILKQIKETGLIPQGWDRKVISRVSKQELWHPPPKGFLKFNIDGASKGNPGFAAYGGVLRDEHGEVLFIFYCHLGKAMNNMAELMAME
eukprot:PITA_08734